MYTIIPTEKFIDDLEYYERKKKFKHIYQDVDKIAKEIEKGNMPGDAIPRIRIK